MEARKFFSDDDYDDDVDDKTHTVSYWSFFFFRKSRVGVCQHLKNGEDRVSFLKCK